ncbi:unannotated protein [freshwater metagenome]|uniref:Unannotated protein n=1 Tax=freshwater metagenome TaxID=449393 RepID=A0A6J7F3P1_9ZZZZ|nr:hypothetical protein [Actinomycetota bacterium]
MRRLLTGLAALAFGFIGSLAAFSASDSAGRERPDSVKLGSLDFEAYCKLQFGGSSVAVLTRTDLRGWRCAIRQNGIFATVEIDTNAACAALFDHSAYAVPDDPLVSSSWQCQRDL